MNSGGWTDEDILEASDGTLHLGRGISPGLREFALLIMLLDVFLVNASEVFVAADDLLCTGQRVGSQRESERLRQRTSMRTFFITSFSLRCSYRLQKAWTCSSVVVFEVAGVDPRPSGDIGVDVEGAMAVFCERRRSRQ